jgi:hypothetical protein
VTRRTAARFAPLVALAAAALTAAAVCADSTQARPDGAAREVDVRAALGAHAARAAARSEVPVRLPARLSLDYDGPVYGSATGSRRSWTLSLAGAPQCAANACMLAFFSGERGGRPAFTRRVALARGLTGFYKPLSCGASCSPPQIQWLQGGVLYDIQAKVGVAGAARQRAALVAAANEAIAARAL